MTILHMHYLTYGRLNCHYHHDGHIWRLVYTYSFCTVDYTKKANTMTMKHVSNPVISILKRASFFIPLKLFHEISNKS